MVEGGGIPSVMFVCLMPVSCSFNAGRAEELSECFTSGDQSSNLVWVTSEMSLAISA